MKSPRSIYVLGSGGLAREILSYCRQSFGPSVELHCVDDHAPTQALGLPHYHQRSAAEVDACLSIMGSGRIEIKRLMLGQIRPPLLTLVHPRAVVDEAELGHGVLVAPGAVVAPGARLGDHVLVNYLASVGHGTTVGDLSVIFPNAAVGGDCVIETGVTIGAGSAIRQGLRIGRDAVVAMGAVVTRDVPAGVTAKGVPARW